VSAVLPLGPLKSLNLGRASSADRLVNAPAKEAREIAEKLRNRQDRNMRYTLYSLQKFIRVGAILMGRVSPLADIVIGGAIRKRVLKVRRFG
jgi:hypothetical protein